MRNPPKRNPPKPPKFWGGFLGWFLGVVLRGVRALKSKRLLGRAIHDQTVTTQAIPGVLEHLAG